MTPPPWHNTHSALRGFAFVRSRHHEIRSEREFAVLDDLLDAIHEKARYLDRDRYGRELWRTGKANYNVKLVVDPRPDPHHSGRLPTVIWVGQSRPPSHIFATRR